MAPHRTAQPHAEGIGGTPQCQDAGRVSEQEPCSATSPMPAGPIMAWRTDDTTARPHFVLGDQTPAGFARHLTTAIAQPVPRDENSARQADHPTRAEKRM